MNESDILKKLLDFNETHEVQQLKGNPIPINGLKEVLSIENYDTNYLLNLWAVNCINIIWGGSDNSTKQYRGV